MTQLRISAPSHPLDRLRFEGRLRLAGVSQSEIRAGRVDSRRSNLETLRRAARASADPGALDLCDTEDLRRGGSGRADAMLERRIRALSAATSTLDAEGAVMRQQRHADWRAIAGAVAKLADALQRMESPRSRSAVINASLPRFRTYKRTVEKLADSMRRLAPLGPLDAQLPPDFDARLGRALALVAKQTTEPLPRFKVVRLGAKTCSGRWFWRSCQAPFRLSLQRP